MKQKKRTAYNSTLSPGKGFQRKKKAPKTRPTFEELKAKGILKKASSLPKKKSLRTLAMDFADSAFSRWTRLMAADHDGYLRCFICRASLHWREAVLMHCEPRSAWSVRYSPINCQAGCSDCNSKDLGDRQNFRARLDEEFGPGTAEANHIASKTMDPHSTQDLNTIGETYAKRVEWIRENEPRKFEER